MKTQQKFGPSHPAFGSVMEGRSFVGDTSGWYRFGFNGQERVDEISGSGNHYTAEYWEIDSRLGRRWNTDPVRVAWESPYAVNRNNPIWLNDPAGNCADCPDPETIGSKSEKIAQGLISRHGGARGLGSDLKSGKFSMTDEEKKQLYTYDDNENISGFTALGHTVNGIIKDHAYLEKYNKGAADFLSNLSGSGGLSNADLTELTSLRSDIVSRTKTEYMRAIFSPENVGTIIGLSLTSFSTSIQTKAFRYIPRGANFAAIATQRLENTLIPGGARIGIEGTNPSIRVLSGTTDDAQALFNRLTVGGKVVEQSSKMTRIKLQNGAYVQLRTYATKSGTNHIATIDINVSSLSQVVTKVKFISP
jgi:hypothetical protein